MARITKIQDGTWSRDVAEYRHDYATEQVPVVSGASAIMLRHCASSPETMADLAMASIHGEVMYANTGVGADRQDRTMPITEVLLPICDTAQKRVWFGCLVQALSSEASKIKYDLYLRVNEIAISAFNVHELDFAIDWMVHTYPLFHSHKKPNMFSTQATMETFLRCPGKTPEQIAQVLSLFKGVCKNPEPSWIKAWEETTGIVGSSMRLPCRQAALEMLHHHLVDQSDVPCLLEDSMAACWTEGVLASLEHPQGQDHLQSNLDFLLQPEGGSSLVGAIDRLARRPDQPGPGGAARFQQALDMIDGLVQRGPDWLASRIRATDFTPTSPSFPGNAERIQKMQMQWATPKPSSSARKVAARL